MYDFLYTFVGFPGPPAENNWAAATYSQFFVFFFGHVQQKQCKWLQLQLQLALFQMLVQQLLLDLECLLQYFQHRQVVLVLYKSELCKRMEMQAVNLILIL